MKVLTVRGEFEKSSSATGSVVEEKTMPVVIEPVVEKVTATNHPDFRGLAEPERTLRRLDFVMCYKELPPVFKIAAYVLVRAFYGIEDNFMFLKIRELLPENEGFSSRARSGMLSVLENSGLIRKKILPKKGVEIELLF